MKLSTQLVYLLSLSIVFVNGDDYVVQLKKLPSLGAKFTEKLLSNEGEFSGLEFLKSQLKDSFSIGSFHGFSGNFTKESLKKLREHPLVADITPNKIFNAFEGEKFIVDDIKSPTDFPMNRGPIDGDEKDLNFEQDQRQNNGPISDYLIQYNAPRHLARLSRKTKLPINQPLNYYYDPKYQGEGIYVYVIDTGIQQENPEFENRVIIGPDCTSKKYPGDYHGHGTHVAGIIGSKTFGVAKKATLVEIKALEIDGSGSLSSVMAAIDAAAAHQRSHGVKGVLNLSLGSLTIGVLNAAIEGAAEGDMVIVVAAGNSALNACFHSPAGSPYAITVGAIDDSTDRMTGFSNYGKCVDIFASGYEVESLSVKKNQISTRYSGTSMAAPIVSGIAAILLQKGVPKYDILRVIDQMSTNGVINEKSKNFKINTPNKLIHNGVKLSDDIFPTNAIYAIDGYSTEHANVF